MKIVEQQYIFGLHAVSALLKRLPGNIQYLYLQPGKKDERMREILNQIRALNLNYAMRDKASLDELTKFGNHQGIVACCYPIRTYTETELFDLIAKLDQPPFLLVLDGVQDPHNLGACLRSADAFGVHAIIIPRDNSVGVTPAVSKVASGALATVPVIQVTNLVRTLKTLQQQGIWLYGTDATAATSLYEVNLCGPLAIVLGGEFNGLRRLTRECCDFLVKIPMVGMVESLNVSVSAGIFMFAAKRAR